jgi:hypothetical protein
MGTLPANVERIVPGAAGEPIRILLKSADARRIEGPFPPKPGTIVEVKPSGQPTMAEP